MFPSLTALDQVLFVALATAEERVGLYTPKDGLPVAATGMINDIDFARYAEAGIVVTASQRELSLMRADAPTPKAGDTWASGSSVYRLHEQVESDSGSTTWLAVHERGPEL